jgi:hypothetical protein
MGMQRTILPRNVGAEAVVLACFMTLVSGGGALVGAKQRCVAAPLCDEPDAVAALRSALDAHCPCGESPTRRAYRSCTGAHLKTLLADRSVPLPRPCVREVKRGVRNSVCGHSNTVACNRRNRQGTKATCRVVAADRCRGKRETACAGLSSCADACNVKGACGITPTSTSTTTAVTTSSTTTSTLAGACGNDIVDALTEECDGSADAACPGQCGPRCRCATLGTVPCDVFRRDRYTIVAEVGTLYHVTADTRYGQNAGDLCVTLGEPCAAVEGDLDDAEQCSFPPPSPNVNKCPNAYFVAEANATCTVDLHVCNDNFATSLPLDGCERDAEQYGVDYAVDVRDVETGARVPVQLAEADRLEGDQCADAQPLVLDPREAVFGMRTQRAGLDANEKRPSCATTLGHTVWYRFEVPQAGRIEITTEGSAIDTVAAIYEGAQCGATLAQLSCDDDAGPGLAWSRLAANVVSERTYWLQIGSRGTTPGGAIEVQWTFTPSDPRVVKKRVFVTKDWWKGNLGGLAGADLLCQAAAAQSPLTSGGTYMAWLADGSSGPAERFVTRSTGPYVLVDGRVIAKNWADLTDGALLAPIRVDQFGRDRKTDVFTGMADTAGIGARSELFTCDNWTRDSFSRRPLWGKSESVDSWWTVRGACRVLLNPFRFCDCGYGSALYCFEQ